MRVALVGDEKQIGHEYVCRGSGSDGSVDGGGRGCAPAVMLATMGETGGAECGLRGGVREAGKSRGTVGSDDGISGRVSTDSDESGSERANVCSGCS